MSVACYLWVTDCFFLKWKKQELIFVCSHPRLVWWLFFAAFLCHQLCAAARAEQGPRESSVIPLLLVGRAVCRGLCRSGLHFLRCFSCFEAWSLNLRQGLWPTWEQIWFSLHCAWLRSKGWCVDGHGRRAQVWVMGLLHLRWQFKVWALCLSPYHKVMHAQQHSQQFCKGSIMSWRNKTHLLVYCISRTNRSILSGKRTAGKCFRKGRGQLQPPAKGARAEHVTGSMHWWHSFWQMN